MGEMQIWGYHGRNRMIHFLQLNLPMLIITKFVSLNPAHGELYLIQHYVIKFVSDLRQVFSGDSGFSTNKIGCHDITEILLKVALYTITLHVDVHILLLYTENHISSVMIILLAQSVGDCAFEPLSGQNKDLILVPAASTPIIGH